MARTDLQTLKSSVDNALTLVQVGEIYHHYSDSKKHYKVLNIGLQEATEKVCVVYQSLDSNNVIWIRDLDSWQEAVMVDGKLVSRFSIVKK